MSASPRLPPKLPRPARLWHLPQLARILWAAHPRATLRARGDDLRLLAGLILRRRIIQMPGRLALTPRGFLIRDGARIHALYVHPNARRQGVGSALIAHAKAQVPRLDLWTAQDNGPARRFYAAHGFYPVALTHGQGNDDGLPDMRLVWERSAP